MIRLFSRPGLLGVGALAALVVGTGAVVGLQLRDDGGSAGPRGPQPVPSGEITAPTEGTDRASAEAACRAEPDVVISDAASLVEALEAAGPGTAIRLEDGTYEGEFVLATAGTAARPIEICGSPAAVLDGGPTDGGYTLHLDGASHARLIGLTVQGGQKGVMADGVSGVLISGITVQDIGDEAIHLRAFSTDNVVERTTIRRTGLRKEKFGEGIYIGTAESNWCDISDCRPDRSDRNVVRDNTISGTTAESVDIKEGTTEGVLSGNTFSGIGMTKADSWVDVKGNGWTISQNTGTDAREDGFQVHRILDGWGRDNVFDANVAEVDNGYAINVTKDEDGNRVLCSNTVTPGGSGLSTIDCA